MKINKYKAILSLQGLMLLLIQVVNAEPYDSLFQHANEHYKTGNYNEATELYLMLLDEGVHSFNLHYNLGNSYFRQRKYAEAILYYERALKIRPGNSNARYNLHLANGFVKDHIPPGRQLFFVEWWLSFSSMLSSYWWLVLHVVLFSLAVASTAWFLLTKNPGYKVSGFRMAIVFAVFSLIFLALSIQRHYSQNIRKEAIIMSESVAVKSGPGTHTISLGDYHKGTKVQIIDIESEWYEIKTADGHIGWIQKQDVEVI